MMQSGPTIAQQRMSEELESIRVMALEAEISKLKKELEDSTERASRRERSAPHAVSPLVSSSDTRAGGAA